MHLESYFVIEKYKDKQHMPVSGLFPFNILLLSKLMNVYSKHKDSNHFSCHPMPTHVLFPFFHFGFIKETLKKLIAQCVTLSETFTVHVH